MNRIRERVQELDHEIQTIKDGVSTLLGVDDVTNLSIAQQILVCINPKADVIGAYKLTKLAMKKKDLADDLAKIESDSR